MHCYEYVLKRKDRHILGDCWIWEVEGEKRKGERRKGTLLKILETLVEEVFVN